MPSQVRLLSCGATQLEWGAVLCLGSIAAFDNSTNAASKHQVHLPPRPREAGRSRRNGRLSPFSLQIRHHGGLGDMVAMLHHRSRGVQKLAACELTC
eukprot:COSAG01_NODE_2105_length_8423_cov_6.483409_2_plen_97_part_00